MDLETRMQRYHGETRDSSYTTVPLHAMALHDGICGERGKNQALSREGKAKELSTWVVFGPAKAS